MPPKKNPSRRRTVEIIDLLEDDGPPMPMPRPSTTRSAADANAIKALLQRNEALVPDELHTLGFRPGARQHAAAANIPKSQYKAARSPSAQQVKQHIAAKLGRYLMKVSAPKFAQLKKENSAVQRQAAATVRMPESGWALMSAVDSTYKVAARLRSKPKKQSSKKKKKL